MSIIILFVAYHNTFGGFGMNYIFFRILKFSKTIIIQRTYFLKENEEYLEILFFFKVESSK
jgi:hypothetical protein